MIFKPELVRRVCEKVNIGKSGYKERMKQEDIETIINTFLEELSKCMINGEDVTLSGFGKFASNIRKERMGFDAVNKQRIRLFERRVIKFTISKNIDKFIRGEKRFERIE